MPIPLRPVLLLMKFVDAPGKPALTFIRLQLTRDVMYQPNERIKTEADERSFCVMPDIRKAPVQIEMFVRFAWIHLTREQRCFYLAGKLWGLKRGICGRLRRTPDLRIPS